MKCVIYMNSAQAGKGYFISVKKCRNLYRTVNKYVALLPNLLQEQNKLHIFFVKKKCLTFYDCAKCFACSLSGLSVPYKLRNMETDG